MAGRVLWSSNKTYKLLSFVVICCFVGVKGCYFTDCPNLLYYNGKRVPPKPKQARGQIPLRKCPPCGLRGMGQCFSSRMCCTPTLGCVIGENEITAPCRIESDVPSECATAGPACIRRDREKSNVEVPGVCAADGLCCNADGCSYDQRCSLTRKEPEATASTDNNVLRAVIGGLGNKFRQPPVFGDYREHQAIKQALQRYRKPLPSPTIYEEEGMYKV